MPANHQNGQRDNLSARRRNRSSALGSEDSEPINPPALPTAAVTRPIPAIPILPSFIAARVISSYKLLPRKPGHAAKPVLSCWAVIVFYVYIFVSMGLFYRHSISPVEVFGALLHTMRASFVMAGVGPDDHAYDHHLTHLILGIVVIVASLIGAAVIRSLKRQLNTYEAFHYILGTHIIILVAVSSAMYPGWKPTTPGRLLILDIVLTGIMAFGNGAHTYQVQLLELEGLRFTEVLNFFVGFTRRVSILRLTTTRIVSLIGLIVSGCLGMYLDKQGTEHQLAPIGALTLLVVFITTLCILPRDLRVLRE